jgi:hypothetical protein
VNPAGLVAIAMAGLWIAYLVPHRLRYRQQLLDSRHEDRFSERLRVVKVTEPHLGHRQVAAPTGIGGSSSSVRLHRSPVSAGTTVTTVNARPARAGHGGGPMDRPHATRDRVSADAVRRSAAEHAQRAAHLARRAAGARRRAALTVVLLLALAGGWTAVGTIGASVALGAAPTVLLAGVLVLGRRAVVAGARADAAWHAGAADRVPLPGPTGAGRVVGRAVRPSDAATEVMARVPGRVGPVEEDAPVRVTETVAPAVVSEAPAQARTTWEPVPVPRPAYTLKPSAPRAEPAPLDPVLLAGGSRQEHGLTWSSTVSEHVTEPSATTTGSLDLDAILARRRASGE